MSRMNQDNTYITIGSGADITIIKNIEPLSRRCEWIQPCLMYGGFFAVCAAIVLLAYFFW